jgi:hypothetical protein
MQIEENKQVGLLNHQIVPIALTEKTGCGQPYKEQCLLYYDSAKSKTQRLSIRGLGSVFPIYAIPNVLRVNDSLFSQLFKEKQPGFSTVLPGTLDLEKNNNELLQRHFNVASEWTQNDKKLPEYANL